MITLRRAQERRHERRRKQDVWLTFSPEQDSDDEVVGFGALAMLNEVMLPASASILSHRHRDADIVTYVREGMLTYEDSLGRSGVIYSGELQRMTAGHGFRHSETNASGTDPAHVFQLFLRPSDAGITPVPLHEQKRFSTAERRGVLRLVASPDARSGSLRVHQDVAIYSAILAAGQHMVHELAVGRSAWCHVVIGEATCGDVVMTSGDGIGVTDERSISLLARTATELMLIDLRAQPVDGTRMG